MFCVFCTSFFSPPCSYFFNLALYILWQKLRLFKFSLRLFIRPNRSQFADSGNMCMMNWAGTPAAQVLPRVRGDTTRGELSSSHDALLPSALTPNTSHLCQPSKHRPHLHQLWFRNGLFIKSGDDRAHIDRITNKISAHAPTQPPARQGFYHTCGFVWRRLFLNEINNNEIHLFYQQ